MDNSHHQEILKAIKKYAGQSTKNQKEKENDYCGTKKVSFHIKTSIRRKIAKDFLKKYKNLSFPDYVSLLNSLYQNGQSYDEISIAGKILEFTPKLRKQLKPSILGNWLSFVEGWAEVDGLCQSNFKAEEILSNWEEWRKQIENFSNDKNVHKRRASLVFLIMPVRQSSDERLSKLAFENIDKLKKEKDILITKAISWLLRSLIKNKKLEVQKYLEKNKTSLPKIAVRETTRKLLTGKK